MTNARSMIAIIIVNYDTTRYTLECIESLKNLEHSEFDYKVLVVDNGSQIEFKLPTRLKNENISIIRTENNLGFTGGNNLGISHAVKYFNPDYFLLLNSDTTVTSTFLRELYLGIQGDDRGMAVSKIYFEKNFEYHKKNYLSEQLGKVIWFAGGTIDWPNLTAFHRGVDEVDRGQFDNLSETDFATGCCVLIKRELIEEVGILDKRYFLYLEDADYSMRAKRKGYKIVFCPKSVIFHKNAGSTGGSGSNIHLYYQTRNRLLFFFKYARFKHKITTLKLIFKKIINGKATERQACFDFIIGRFGKQPII